MFTSGNVNEGHVHATVVHSYLVHNRSIMVCSGHGGLLIDVDSLDRELRRVVHGATNDHVDVGRRGVLLASHPP